jgi:hypothetical protein
VKPNENSEGERKQRDRQPRDATEPDAKPHRNNPLRKK